MTVTISDLRLRLTLQQEVVVADGGGGYAPSWQDFATVWAALESLNGRETDFADRLQSDVPCRFWIRYRSDVTAEVRAVVGGRSFSIVAVTDPDNRQHWLRLDAIETPAN